MTLQDIVAIMLQLQEIKLELDNKLTLLYTYNKILKYKVTFLRYKVKTGRHLTFKQIRETVTVVR